MVQFARHRSFGIMLTLLLALATAATGWAHNIPSAPDDAEAASLAAFAAIGGGASDICADAGLAHNQHEAHDTDCSACRLGSAATLPEPAGNPRRAAIVLALTQTLPVTPQSPGLRRPQGWSVRAPPLA